MGVKTVVEHQIKFNKTANAVFTALAGLGIKALGCGRKTDDRGILFVSDIGKSYSGSPRAIYERLVETGAAARYNITWAFADKDAYEIPGCRVVRLDSPEYFRTALIS